MSIFKDDLDDPQAWNAMRAAKSVLRERLKVMPDPVGDALKAMASTPAPPPKVTDPITAKVIARTEILNAANAGRLDVLYGVQVKQPHLAAIIGSEGAKPAWAEKMVKEAAQSVADKVDALLAQQFTVPQQDADVDALLKAGVKASDIVKAMTELGPTMGAKMHVLRNKLESMGALAGTAIAPVPLTGVTGDAPTPRPATAPTVTPLNLAPRRAITFTEDDE